MEICSKSPSPFVTLYAPCSLLYALRFSGHRFYEQFFHVSPQVRPERDDPQVKRSFDLTRFALGGSRMFSTIPVSQLDGDLMEAPFLTEQRVPNACGAFDSHRFKIYTFLVVMNNPRGSYHGY
jgi:hypothetical protein